MQENMHLCSMQIFVNFARLYAMIAHLHLASVSSECKPKEMCYKVPAVCLLPMFICFSLCDRLVTRPATAKSKSKSTLNGQVQVRVQVLFKKGKSKFKSKSSRKKRTCKQFHPIQILFLLLVLSKTLYRKQKRTNP